MRAVLIEMLTNDDKENDDKEEDDDKKEDDKKEDDNTYQLTIKKKRRMQVSTCQ